MKFAITESRPAGKPWVPMAPWAAFVLAVLSLSQAAIASHAPIRSRREVQTAYPASKAVAPSVLTRVSQVRSLSAEEASRLIPVRITGIVTVLSGYLNSFFLQDSTAGISVDRTDKADVRVGDIVEVTGTSSAGLFAPSLSASYVKVVGHAPPPLARVATLVDLIGGAQDSQWIEVQGVVHAAKVSKLFGHDVLSISVSLGAGSINLLLQDFAGFDDRSLVDATVRARGVCSTDFNEKRQFVGLGLYVPKREDIAIEQPARADPFSAPTTPTRKVMQFGQTAHRVKVTGITTFQIPGHVLYLQDGNDGIRVQTTSTDLVQPGMYAEAVGFPAMGNYSPVLDDGVFRVLGKAAPISPLKVSARDVIGQKAIFNSIPYDEQLVQLQGKVEESHIQGGQRTWIIRQDKEIFEAHLPLTAGTVDPSSIATGSILQLSGICMVYADSDRTPVSFGLLLRSSADVVVLTRAPWWTAFHTLLVLGAVAAAMAVVALWVVILRKRVEQQTRIIRASEGRFRNLAEHDVLTGLPNRLLLEDRIRQCLERCKRRNSIAMVLTLDVDRFKQINDTYGHPVGDECLKVVAARLLASVRQEDTVARTGGEEFILLLVGFTNADSARRIGSKILDLFHESVIIGEYEIKLTVSIGGAIYPEDGLDSDTLRKRSDQALYEAKRSGRNRAVFATEKLSASLDLETAIETKVREGLSAESFLLFYQPIYNAKGAICRFEALLRTSDATLSKHGPSRFIPVAESSGLILPLGRWVLEQTCRQIVEWQSVGAFDLPIGVNVSGQQLTHRGFAEEVIRTLQRFRIEPRLLELELTETTAMTELAPVAETVAKLAESGITFAIDDFGTGYSSLSRLHELPIKALKIDRSFVMNLENHGGFQTIVQAIIQMAKSLDLQVVAEGVETQEQFNLLSELGCDFFQGYLFSLPLAAEAVLPALAENRARLLGAAS